MRIILSLFSVLNGLLGVLAIMPCLMAGLMSMDSPQAQHSVGAHIACYMMLSFPLVCITCSFLTASSALDRRPVTALCLSLFPLAEAAAFFGYLYVLQWLGSGR